MMNESENVIEMRQICTTFGSQRVHEGLDLSVRRGEILALVGGSGSGKSTLLREMIMLQRPSSGSIKLFGTELQHLAAPAALALRLRFGVMFQHGGLFGALTVLENIGLPLREHRCRGKSRADNGKIDAICAAKLALSGLAPAVGAKYPNQLSGGMLKRAALARALVLEPELLFLDEPSAGLDPANAAGLDELIRILHASRVPQPGESGSSDGGSPGINFTTNATTNATTNPTIVMITHDLDLMWQVAERVLVLGEGKVLASGTMQQLSKHQHPLVRAYFDGARGRAAQIKAATVPTTEPTTVPTTEPTTQPPPGAVTEPTTEPPPEPITEPIIKPINEPSGAAIWKPK
jgi:phospholipid/cholesterol/gamma-HCH transport system ATP-binding protein